MFSSLFRTRSARRRPLRRAAVLRLEILEDRTVPSTSGIGVFTPGTHSWSLRNEASAGPADAAAFQYGTGLIPVVGDWNGDGKADIGTFDPKTATWSLRYEFSSGPADAGVFQFGTPNSIPVVGDWNGDGRADIGTFDPRTATWTLRYGASPGIANAGVFQFGARNSIPVVGDWNGSHKYGIATFQPGSDTWTLRQTATAGAPDSVFTFGAKGALPVAGDWNGSGTFGIGTFQPGSASWMLRQTATSGAADAGTFTFGTKNSLPVAGDFRGPAAPANALATVTLKPLDLNLLGLEVQTSPITVTISANKGDGKLLGNLLSAASGLVDLKGASNALNTVLSSTVDLLNAASLKIGGVLNGTLTNATVGATQVLELYVAPVHLDLLGVQVDTNPIRVTITAHSGKGLLLGNVVTDLTNLFNPPLPAKLDITTINGKLQTLLNELNQQIPGVTPAPVPLVTPSTGQVVSLTVPPLDVNLLGLVLKTSPITVNATAQTGNGLLLGNVLTTALNTLGATPQNLADLSNNLNALLAKVIGVLNASNLTLPSSAVSALPPVLQTLLSPVLTAPAPGSTAPVLDLVIASANGTSPPVNVNLLGLNVTTSNIDARLTAQTGDGQVLGNLLYNLANLANPNGSAGLLNLLNLLGSGALTTATTVTGSTVAVAPLPPAQQLLQVKLKPLDLNLLGLEVQTNPITVTVSTQGGNGKLLGNLLTGITTLINVQGVNNALNNVLATTVNLVNSTSLSVAGVGAGALDSVPAATTPVLDLFVAPVHLDLLGLQVDTSPIHLTITAHSGAGLVLGNVVTDLANLFNPPLPAKLDITTINSKLQTLLDELNQQVPGINPAPVPLVTPSTGQVVSLTVPPLDVNLLGLVLKTSPITVNATAQTGNGLLLGNVLTTALNTLGATPQNLADLSNKLNALLGKVVGVLNASSLSLSSGALGALPTVLQTLASPTLIAPSGSATTSILDLVIASPNGTTSPVDVNLLGLDVTTSNITARLLAQTGKGQVLGNLLYNVANLLNANGSTTLLFLLTQLGQLTL